MKMLAQSLGYSVSVHTAAPSSANGDSPLRIMADHHSSLASIGLAWSESASQPMSRKKSSTSKSNETDPMLPMDWSSTTVRVFLWLESVKDWMTHDPNCSMSKFVSLMKSVPVGFSGRTSLALCPPRQPRPGSPNYRATTSRSSSGKSRGSSRKSRKKAGKTPASASDPSEPVRGVCLTLNLWEGVRCTATGENEVQCHNGAGGSSLSRLLETAEDWMQRHPGRSFNDWLRYLSKFFLSQIACQGILRRAKKRGRGVPAHLEAALETIAQRPCDPGSPVQEPIIQDEEEKTT